LDTENWGGFGGPNLPVLVFQRLSYLISYITSRLFSAYLLHVDKLKAEVELLLTTFPRQRINKMMKISEVISDIDRQRSKRLDKNAAQATYQAKQERYRQNLKSYNERMRNRMPGAKIPKRPQPPKPPSLN